MIQPNLTGSANGHARSYYAASAGSLPGFPSLDGDLSADVCVIGGGFTGSTAPLNWPSAGCR